MNTLQQQLTTNRSHQAGFAQAIIDNKDNKELCDSLLAEYLKLVGKAAAIEKQLLV